MIATARIMTLLVLLSLGAPAGAAAPPLASGLNLSLTCPNGDPMWLSSDIHPPILAVVIMLVPQAVARRNIGLNEARLGAEIDPAYLNNQRVIVQDRNRQRWYVLVPAGMTVHVGDQVSFVPRHADLGNHCLYTPNLIVP